jgi:hypothetical protein
MNPENTNPFAAPQSEVLSSDPRHSMLGGAWRDGDQLVVRDKTSLPDRCVKCNDTSQVRRLKRRFAWHSPMLYLLILLNLIIYVIVALAVQKRATLEFSLCNVHRSQRRLAIAVGWLGVVAFIAMLVGVISLPPSRAGQTDWTPILTVAAFTVLLGTLIYAIVRSQPLKPTRIENGVMWMKGAGLPFLESLEAPQQRVL